MSVRLESPPNQSKFVPSLASRWQIFEFKKSAPPPSSTIPTHVSMSASRKKPLPTVESSSTHLILSIHRSKAHLNRKVGSINFSQYNSPMELIKTSPHMEMSYSSFSKVNFKSRANLHPALEKELMEKKDPNQQKNDLNKISESNTEQIGELAEYVEYVPNDQEVGAINVQVGNNSLKRTQESESILLQKVRDDFQERLEANSSLLEKYNRAAIKIQCMFRVQKARKVLAKLKKRKKDREYCAKELLSTERTYVESLNILREVYLIPLQENLKEPKPLISASQYKLFFGHLETIMNVNKMFLVGCEKVLSNYTSDVLISPLFHGYTHLFKSYSTYCNNFEAASSAIKQHRLSNPEFAAWLKLRDKDPRTNRLGMQSYLILPIQRIPRYRLLLQDLIKNTDILHKDYQGLQKCLGEILSVAEHLNSAMKQIEASIQLLNIQSQFQNLPEKFEIQASWRTLLKEGGFKVLPDYQSIHVHLFNDIIVFSKKNKSQYYFRSKAELGHTKLYNYKYNHHVEEAESRFMIKSLNFEIELVCSSEEEKFEWLKLINEQIELTGGPKLNVVVDTKNEKSTFLEALSDDIGEELDPEDCLEEMKTKGSTMLKYCRSGKPHFRHFVLSGDEKKICWGSKNKRTADSKVLLARVTDLKTGQTTDLFKKYINPDVEHVSMSLLYGKGRSLDLVASDKREFAVWLTGLRFLLQNGPRANAGEGSAQNENIVKTIEKAKFDHKFQEIGDAYTWGQSNRGSLGHGDQEDQPIPLVMKDFLYLDVFGVYCSDSVAFGVMTNGALFSWGSGKDGRTGHGDEIDRLKPTRVEAFRGMKVIRVAIGSTHTLVLLNDGSVYAFGNGEYGQLGCGASVTSLLKPKKIEAVLEHHKVQHIVCGAMHCAAITNNGEMYVWGRGEDGQLGLGSKENVFTPTVVHTLHNESIVTCALGMWHTMALTREGRIYIWGDTTYGQCGLGKHSQQNKSQLVPVVIPSDLLPRKIASLSAGSSHSGAIAEDGSIWMWGNGMYGQLGVGEKENSPVPVCVRDLQHEKAVQITCGVNHTMILTESNDVYSWGAGTYGRLGIREEKDQPLPRLIEFLREKEVREINAGGCMSCCVCAHQWVPDLDAKKCMNCNRDFTIIRRRHHCRYCGGLFCGACSSKRVTLLRFGYDNRVRVCDKCFQILKRESGAQGSN